MFPGDRSGDMLNGTLYQTGFASQPTSATRDDGLTLYDVYITAPRAAPLPATNPRPKSCATAVPTWSASWIC